MNRFAVGDRVVANRSPADSTSIMPGWAGTVVAVDVGTFDYAVRWDDSFPEGYAVNDCKGHIVTEKYHGWCVAEEILDHEQGDDSDLLCALSSDAMDSFLIL